MPYSSIYALPEYLHKVLPPAGLELFLELYNSAFKNYNEDTAFQMAWEGVKLKFQREGDNIVIHNHYYQAEPEVHSLEMSPEETNIAINSETEEIIMDAVLADTNPNSDGKFFSEKELVALAEQINVFGSTLPDVDHEKLMGLVKKYGRDSESIRLALKNEKGLMKTIKASVEKGRLWIRAVLDKRYKNHLEKFKGLSIEAFADVENGEFKNAEYLGFTFTNNPKLKGARIAI